MAPPSSYLRFLPPTLYQNEPADPNFSLGGFLRIAEKLLTGIADGVTVAGADGKPVVDLQSKIANISRLFDPFRTPAVFLPYLASWVGLELPAVWNEYQQRKVISEIIGIYQQRGSRRSLQRYMDIYTAGDKRPLIFVCEGGQLFRSTPVPNQLAEIESFIPHSPLITPREVLVGPDGTMFVADEAFFPARSKGVFRFTAAGYSQVGQPPTPQRLLPRIWEWILSEITNFGNNANGFKPLGTGTCRVAQTVDPAPFPSGLSIEITKTGGLGTATFAIATSFTNFGASITIPANGVYGPDGQGIALVFADNGVNGAFVLGDDYIFSPFVLSPVPPEPGMRSDDLEALNWSPHCMAIDLASPYHLYMLSMFDVDPSAPNTVPVLHRLSAPDFLTSASDGIALRKELGIQWPQAMLFHQNGHLLILDRGIDLSSGMAEPPIDVVPKPFIVEVQLDGPGLKVVGTTVHKLSTVVNPASMCMLSNGDLIVGDGRDPTNPVPADLVRVEPGNGWKETRLLASVTANPLAAPVAVTRIDDGQFYVLDAGIRPWETFEDLSKRLLDPKLDRSIIPTFFVPSADAFNPFLRTIANPPAVYRVELAGPSITRVSETSVLCRPAGMAFLDGNLYISERGMELLGEIFDPNGFLASTVPSSPSTFSVEINYAVTNQPTPAEQRRILNTISDLVDAEKPANTRAILLAMVTTTP